MDTFSALSDPTRRNILELLVNSGRMSATEIYDRFDTSPQAISQHLKILRDTELVLVEKRAQQRIYALNPVNLSKVEEWIRKINKQWNERFNRLNKILENEKKKKK